MPSIKFDSKEKKNDLDQFKYSPYKLNENVCKNNKFKILNHQKYVSRYIETKGNLLVYHGLGSGKTCTAILASEMFKQNYINKDGKMVNIPGKNKIIYVAPANLIAQTRNEILGQPNLDTCSSKLLFDNVPQNYQNKSIINRIKLLEQDLIDNPELKPQHNPIIKGLRVQLVESINDNYEFYSYERFINKLFNTDGIHTSNWKYSPGKILEKGQPLTKPGTLLVIDEIQNMISETGKSYKKLKYAIDNHIHEKTRILLLTATPIFNRPVELGLTMNLLRPKQQFPDTHIEFEKNFVNIERTSDDKIIGKEVKNSNKLLEMCKGRISYFAGGNPSAYPYIINTVIQSPMSQYQMNVYRQTLMDEIMSTYTKAEDVIGKRIGDTSEDTNLNLFSMSKQACNVCNVDKLLNSLKQGDTKGNLSLIKEHSQKFYQIIQLVLKSKRPVFIHTNYVDKSVNVLEQCFKSIGYASYGKPSKKKVIAKWTGEMKVETKDKIQKVFNKPENEDGSLIHVLLGTVKEGLSLKNVEQVHLIDPWWNMNKLKQIAARAVRYKSHCMLKPSDRYVHIFTHLSVFTDKTKPDNYISTGINQHLLKLLKDIPDDRKDRQASRNMSLHSLKFGTVDQTMYKKANEKDILSKQFENIMKMSAVDRELNKEVNILPIEEFYWQHPMNNTFIALKRNPIDNKFYINTHNNKKNTRFGKSLNDIKSFTVTLNDIMSLKYSDFGKTMKTKTYPKYGVIVKKNGNKTPVIDIKEPMLKNKNNIIKENHNGNIAIPNEPAIQERLNIMDQKRQDDIKKNKRIIAKLYKLRNNTTIQRLIKTRSIDDNLQLIDKLFKRFKK